MTNFRKLLPSRHWTAALLLAAAVLVVAPRPSHAADAEWATDVCSRMISAAEQVLGIPRQLLGAIARVESGRWISDRRANFAWPWTVGAEGDGNYYESKAQAIAAVQRLRARGVKNIDVGCLQVNLKYHPHAFKSLEAAFDPMENTIYAARLLKGLYDTSRSWTNAVALYHSANPSARYQYVTKVDKLWYDEHRRANLALIEATRQRLLAMLSGNEPLPSE